MEFRINRENELADPARKLAQQLKGNDCIFLSGDLGSGKTTFVKYFLSVLEINDEVTSPTFSIVNEYGTNALKVYHIDLYRLKDQRELVDAGIEEILYSDGIKIIEWPELAEGFLGASDPLHRLFFGLLSDGSRKIIFL